MGKLKKTDVKETEVIVENEDIDKKCETAKKEKTKKSLSREELITQLNKKEDEVLVEFKNISRGRFLYMNKYEDKYLDLEPGETETLSLAKAKEICSKSKTSFKDGSLIITKVYDDNYSLSDILKYLKIDKIQHENYDVIEHLIMNTDMDEFENILRNKDKKFVKRVAGKAIYMHNSDEYEFELSLKQDAILRNLLNLEVLIY